MDDSPPVRGPLSRYSICRQEPRDEDQILSLLRRTVGETGGSRKTAEFWRWKHAESPFGPSYSLCAWAEEGRLAGLRTVMWWSLRGPEGVVLRSARPVDTATDPDHQRRGIFSTLTKRAIEDLREQGAALIFNTPNASSLPGYLKMGWEVVARWPLYVKPVRWMWLARRLGVRTASPAAQWQPVPPMADPAPTWPEIRAELGGELESLIAEGEGRRTHVGLRTERTLSYLDWRYGGHPEVDYHAYVTRDRGEPDGIVIGRTVDGFAGLRALLVTELFMRTPDSRTGARVLRVAARRSGCDYLLAYFSRGTVEHRALRRAGFIRAPGRGYTFVTRSLVEGPGDPTRPSAWDLSLGELEIF